jgi:hypothetical protein
MNTQTTTQKLTGNGFRATAIHCAKLTGLPTAPICHTQLHDAVLQQNLPLTISLLSSGVDPNSGTIGGFTPLHIAVKIYALKADGCRSHETVSNAEHIIEALLGHGASLEMRDQLGRIASEASEGGAVCQAMRNALAAKAQAGAFYSDEDVRWQATMALSEKGRGNTNSKGGARKKLTASAIECSMSA